MVLPSAVETLSLTTIRKPISPEVESALVAVVSVKEVPAPEVPATPQVPTEAIAMRAYYSDWRLIVEKVCQLRLSWHSTQ